MGCDIHAYVEFAEPRNDERPVYWQNLTRNGGSRNYILFGVLAGVRYPDAQLFEPKGMPDDGIGFYTSDDYWLSVAPESHPDWADTEGYTSIESATRWIEQGSSIGRTDADGRLRNVSDPDSHTHSWLTADELEQALDHYRVEAPKQWPGAAGTPPEWAAMLAAMRSFEANGQLTRVVFWFDN